MNKMKEMVTKAIGSTFSEEKIRQQAMNGSHKGESMSDIAFRIFTDPNVIKEDGKLIMNGKVIGWYDANRGFGYIDEKAYASVKSRDELIESLEPDDYDYEYEYTNEEE